MVIPVYQAQFTIEELTGRIRASLQGAGLSYEVILVDDGSRDASWQAVLAACARDGSVRGVRLSRNFGQHSAITAGLERASGHWTVVMDCDLQDRPEEIPLLHGKTIEGYDIVLAKRADRQDSLFRRWASAAFYSVLRYLTGTAHDAGVGNFGIYSRQVVREICNMREHVRYLPTMVRWVGFRSCTIDVTHAARTEGTSNYNLGRMLDLALDIALAYSDRPLRLAVKFGFAVAFIGLLMTIWTVANRLLGNLDGNPMGYASILSSIWMLAGCILIILGTVGLYVGKIFDGVKNRQLYIVMEER